MSFAFGFKFDDADDEPTAVTAPCPGTPSSGLPIANISWSSATLPPDTPYVDVAEGLKKIVIDPDSVVGLSLDVVSGKYEGGAKVWECTRDLLSYMRRDISKTFEGAKLFDMGCGAGILGAFALTLGADHVVFQDLNAEVLLGITQPNVELNFGKTDNASFISGSWQALNELLDNNAGSEHRAAYDAVLASEIIYNVQYYPDICRVLQHIMKATGIAYIASKRFYYGVGGSVPLFLDFVEKDYPSLRCEVVQSFEDGHSMIRDILRITK